MAANDVWNPPQDDEELSALRKEQVSLLYTSLPSAMMVNILLGLLLVDVQGPTIDARISLGWLALLCIAQLGRFLLLTAWKRSAPDIKQAFRWFLLFRIGAIATGTLWGIGAILLSPHGDVLRQVYVAFVLAGLTGGAITSLAIDRISTFGFVLPALVPFTVFLGLQNQEIALGMSAMGILFIFFISGSAMRSRHSLHENVLLRIKAVKDEQQLRQSEERLNEAQRLAHIGNWELDLIQNKLHWSDEIYQIFDKDPEKFRASYEAFLNVVHPGDREMVNKAYTDSLVDRKPYDIDHRLLMEDGSIKYVHEHCVTFFDADGKATRSMGTVQDITERKTLEMQIEYLAYHDILTGLLNRALFVDRLQQALAIAERDKTSLALMFIDLDRFKHVNDQYGHDVGDLLLKEVAKRIEQCLRKSDSLGRLGGDEFIVLLPKVRGAEDAILVARKIHHLLDRPYALTGYGLSISASIGVALYPEHADEEEQLIKLADTAMYFAKAGGRDSVKLYQPKMQESNI